MICPNYPLSYSTIFFSLAQLSHSLRKANVSDNYSVIFVLVLNIKTVFKAVNVGFKIASSLALLLRDSTYDQLVAAVNNSVLPAGANLIQISEGCVSLKVQVVNLSALETLWRLYQDGTLEASLQALFVTDEMRELAGGEQVEAIVTIEPQEYEIARNELAAFETQGKRFFCFTGTLSSLHAPLVLETFIILRITRGFFFSSKPILNASLQHW